MEKEYNGWTNYATWVVKLWIDDEERSQIFWRERAKFALETAEATSGFTAKENAALTLRDHLQEVHEDMIGDMPGIAGFAMDLINAALSDVNWWEIAESLIEEANDE